MSKTNGMYRQVVNDHGVAKHRRRVKKIAVLTSGGDAPGMNAAIRAVVRTALYHELDVCGIHRGYLGLAEGDIQPFEASSVGSIIHQGGTILKTSRYPEFKLKANRRNAYERLRQASVDGLVVIGGNGTFTGAHKLWQEFGLPVAGVPATIDNDLFGTDVTIGFDTAINTALNAIDNIRDTASAHDRIFIIEVMGRNSGYIGLDVGIAGGAEAIVIPESRTTVAQLASQINRGRERGKSYSILVVAEGHTPGRSLEIASQLEKKHKLPARVVILGHIQRGGRPTARDRKIASVYGALAVREMLRGRSDFMTGIVGWEPHLVPLGEAITKKKPLPEDLTLLAQILAT